LSTVFPEKLRHSRLFHVTADQTARHKPDPEPLLELLRRAGIRPEQALYIGDTIHDAQCAAGAGVAFGLAAWGADSPQSIRAEYYFAAPREVAPRLDGDDPLGRLPYLKWAMELQFVGQAGVTYSRDPFDRERFLRIREIAAEMLAAKSEMPLEKVKELFCSEHGFQTPKLDTRAAIFRDGKILLVRENDGRWSLPGGWVDVNESIRSNTEKEVREEAGLTVAALRLIAAQDRNRHNPPPYAYGVCKIFVLCGVIGGEFRENLETTGCAYFGRDELPQLAEEKNTAAQIRMCFDAAAASDWRPVFD
jgi:HAD hydrolase, family IA, variant 1